MDFFAKRSDFALCIPVLNEGSRIREQLKRLRTFASSGTVDVILVDGGSTDGALEMDFLRENGVRTLLTLPSTPGLGAQLKLAFQFATDQGYKGCVLIDGNGKDDPEAIPRFISALNEGFDFVQGSRFVPGGKAINTPPSRYLAIKLIHAPLLSFASGVSYTDTTNGFRAYSRKFLEDPRIKPFLDPGNSRYDKYDLHYFLSLQAGRLKFRVCEIPVTRAYPETGKIPTKISFVRGNFNVLVALVRVCLSKSETET
jgi:dolichol-phosphate mannosyltransferase